MKRSHLTSLMGALSLGLIISSFILSPNPSNIDLIPLGIFFSILLISGILGASFGVRTSKLYNHYNI
ncbi:MAG: hypothetical protein ACFFAK_00200 [Promethearchaeota archaeon]